MEQDFTTGNLRRLSRSDYSVADDDPDVRGWTVVDAAGRAVGKVDDLIVDTEARKVRYLEIEGSGTGGRTTGYADTSGADLDRDNRRVILRPGRERLSGAEALADSSMSHEPRESGGRMRGAAPGVERMTRAEEEVRVGTRAVQAGEVRIGKHVETSHHHDSVPVMREEVHVERRPVTDARPASEIRGSATDEIRVPVMEEEVVVDKRPVVREEIVVSKEQVQDTRDVDVEVRREEFDIEDDRNRNSPRSPDDETRGGRR